MPAEMLSASSNNTNQALSPGLGKEEYALIAVASLFLLLACYHTTLNFLRRSWLTYTLSLSSFFQTLSLLAEAYTLNLAHPDRPHPALNFFSLLFALLSPTLLLLSITHILGRSAWYWYINTTSTFATANASSNPRLTRFYGFIRWNTPTFSILVLITNTLQIIGIFLTISSNATDPDDTDNHRHLAHAGHIFTQIGRIAQFIVSLAFTLVTWRFRLIAHSYTDDALKPTKPWTRLLTVLLLNAALITTHQAYQTIMAFILPTINTYIFDLIPAIPLLAILLLFAIIHPSRCLPAHYTRLRLPKGNLASSLPAKH